MLTNNPSLRNKSLCARMKVAHVELFRRDAKLVPRYAVTAIYGNREHRIQKRISALRRIRARLYNSILEALRILHTSICKRPRNKPGDACLWKLSKRNKIRTSKQLWFVASTETFNVNQVSYSIPMSPDHKYIIISKHHKHSAIFQHIYIAILCYYITRISQYHKYITISLFSNTISLYQNISPYSIIYIWALILLLP